jgi:FKBP-type peptidyl-prolyl cis-trans isomerase FkpA
MSRSPRFSRSLRALAILALSSASACLETEAPEQVELVANSCAFTFAFDTTAMTKTSSGLFYKDISVGGGSNVTSGDAVATYYTAWYVDGESFDDAAPPQNPFVYTAGVGQVIRGYDEGVLGMKVGGCRQLVIPPGLGYGNAPPAGIRSNAWLVFEVSLVGQQD